MIKLQSLWLNRIIEAFVVLGCFVVIVLLIAPVFSVHPSKSAVGDWEAKYSPFLPLGYSDFRGHWQSQDVGVHIFSFRYPEGVECEQVLSELVGRLGHYRVQERLPVEVALRRSVTYSNPDGYDEFRFVCVPSTRRVYAMFANLDSEMDVHSRLVDQLHKTARGEPE